MPVGVSLPEGTEIEPDMVSVTLTGSDDDLSKVDAEKIIVHALIDSVSSVVTNETELPLSVHVPSSALLFDVAPSPQCVRLIPGRNQRETAMESAPVKINTVTGALYDEESENPGGDDGATLLPPQTNDLNTAAAMLGFCDNSAASTNAPVLSLPASLELPREDGEATTNQFLIKEQQMKEDK